MAERALFLVEPPQQSWSTFWKQQGLQDVKKGFDARKSELGGNYSQAELAKEASERSGMTVHASAVNNWLNKRGCPPKPVGMVLLEIVGGPKGGTYPIDAPRDVSYDDVRKVLGILSKITLYAQAHAGKMEIALDTAYDIVQRALTEGRTISSLSAEDVMGYLWLFGNTE